MRKAILCASVSLIVACAPRLSDGEGARCSETIACDEGSWCYRGFCLPETASPAEAPPATPADADDDAASGTALAPDAGTGADAAPDSAQPEADPPSSAPVAKPNPSA